LNDSTADEGLDRLLRELRQLFRDMDHAYGELAGAYGFSCDGCPQTCCTSVFRHHTILEFELLRRGIDAIPEETRAGIHTRAKAVGPLHAAGENAPCPLYVEGRCAAYDVRPMICRLHGLPHELRHPLRGRITGSGCHRFNALSPSEEPKRYLDRTGLYQRFAQLERRARILLETDKAADRTIADMLREMAP